MFACVYLLVATLLAHCVCATLEVEVLRKIPHDTNYLTEGLFVEDGVIWESTGMTSANGVHKLNLENGSVIFDKFVDQKFFCEGISKVGERLYQMTYKAGKTFVYNTQSLELTDTLTYTGEGWGMTFDPYTQSLITNHGSYRLVSRDPDTFEQTKEVVVKFPNGSVVNRLNELEYDTQHPGHIWSNVFMSDWVYLIELDTGLVLDRFEFDRQTYLTQKELSALPYFGNDVLNGIALLDPIDTPNYVAHLLLTGKQWPWYFEVLITSPDGSPFTSTSTPGSDFTPSPSPSPTPEDALLDCEQFRCDGSKALCLNYGLCCERMEDVCE